jgi:hypothetical protein
MRCARRTGRRESVKFAEEKSASVDKGGRPCLGKSVHILLTTALIPYLTRSTKLRAYNGLLARLDTSSSAIEVELGSCDHVRVTGGEWCFDDSNLRG